MNEIDQTKLAGKSQLYLLSWQDALERIDMLLLECRHLQINIIHYLREPGLLKNLRKEEKFLWGNDWESYFYNTPQNNNPPYHNNENLAIKWVRSYPIYKKAKKDSNDKVEDLIYKISKYSNWGTTQIHNYDILCAVQYLKQNLLRDKIALCQYAYVEAHIHLPFHEQLGSRP